MNDVYRTANPSRHWYTEVVYRLHNLGPYKQVSCHSGVYARTQAEAEEKAIADHVASGWKAEDLISVRVVDSTESRGGT